MGFKIGRVVSYFEKIKMAVIELDAPLSKGEQISFVINGEILSEQTVENMQVEHLKVESAGKGDIVSITVKGDIKSGAEIYKH